MNAMTSKRDQKPRYPAIGKIYFKIPVCLESPFIIGAGEDENSDLDVIREAKWRELPAEAQFPAFMPNAADDRLFIPASSIVGACRAFMKVYLFAPNGTALQYLFGEENPGDDNTPQSALQCEDVYLEGAKVVIRDGVRINHETNLADEGSKYNYEIVEYPHRQTFDISFEITQRNLDPKHSATPNVTSEFCWQVVKALIDGMNAGQIRLGAKTNKGFGKLRVDEKQVQAAVLDFREPNDVEQWLCNQPAWKAFTEFSFTPLTVFSPEFSLEAYFQLKSSLIIRSYADDPRQPDVVSMESFDAPVIPGASTMGAIRHRAKKILQTVGNADVEEKMRHLFGIVDEKKDDIRRGRVVIEETPVRDVVKEVQTRIKIDRFTGGTIHGALLEAMPLWQTSSDGDGLGLKITIREFQDWEAGLFLHILKDLWTGDLAIGGEKNIGRGVLKALAHKTANESYAAKISWGAESVKLGVDAKGAPVCSAAEWEKLERFATKFNEAIKNANA